MKTSLIAIALACAAANGAHAQSAPAQAERPDPRIRIIAYDSERVIPLRGHIGYQMLLEFDPAERIENVAIGDSLAWQVTPNRAATMLFLKPIVAGAATNMTVVTTLRRYSFQLSAQEPRGASDPTIIYSVRFSYPEPPPPPPPPPTPVAEPTPPPTLNLSYTLNGTDRFGAVRVFDDGRATYFQFPSNVETPAIFALSTTSNEEELVNAQTRPPYVVVDQVSPGFVLRSGRHRLRVRNDAFGIQEPTP